MDIRNFLKNNGNKSNKSLASRHLPATRTSSATNTGAPEPGRSAVRSQSQANSEVDPGLKTKKSKRARKADEDAQRTDTVEAAQSAGYAAGKDVSAEAPPSKKARWVPRTDAPPNHGNKPLPVGAPNCLSGCVFVISGVLDSLLREECQDLCKQYGARVVSAVSKKVTHGIIGTEPGEAKLSKLKANGAPLIDEEELFRMISKTLPKTETDPMDVEKEGPGHRKEDVVANQIDEGDDGDDDDIIPVRRSRSSKPLKANRTTSKANSGSEVKFTPVPTTTKNVALWVDKYRPSNSNELVANNKAIQDLKQWLLCWKNKFLRGDGHATKLRHRGDVAYAAALLVGPPGIGKTTAAHVICRESGFEPHEMNASDVRNKAGVQTLAETMMVANTMSKYLSIGGGRRGYEHRFPNGQVLIMDEVDGMSGGDRGGSQELIRMIKKTKVPIICIANDESSANMRSVGNNCFKIRFRKPLVTQVTKRLAEIAKREGFRAVQDQTLAKLAEGCNGDVRQMINLLQTWRVTSPALSFTEVKDRLDVEGKTVIQKSVFELAKSFFYPGIEGSTNSLIARTDNYFAESDLIPLFVQENYISTVGASQSLEALASAAECIAEGDICERIVRQQQRWDLMPTCAILSAIRPGLLLAGGYAGQPMFPSYLGNLSKGNKWKRIIQGLEMKVKAVKTSSGSTTAFRLDYIPALTTCLATPLIRNGAAGVDEVIDILDAYYLEKDPDWEEILEAGVYSKGRSPLENIPGSVKSTMTREYNSRVHGRSTVTGTRVGVKTADTSVVSAAKKAEKEAVGILDDEEDVDEEEGEGSAEEDVAKEFGVKKRGSAGGRGRGRGKARGKASSSRSAASNTSSRSAPSSAGSRGRRGRGRGRKK